MKPIVALPGLACCAVLLSMLVGWGFTVDDALISARVAHHLHVGLGYRFNPGAAVVDCVTPLGWAYLLAPFAGSGPLGALSAARAIGAVSVLLAAGYLGWLVQRDGGRRRGAWVLATLAVCLPLGAWSVAGMETGLVIALTTFALGPTRTATIAAGLAAALRPELLPWALVLCSSRVMGKGRPRREVVVSILLASGPFLTVAAVRFGVFGYPAPLAVFVKPASMSDGLRYALGALCLTGPAYLLLSQELRRLEQQHRAVLFAALAHWVVLWGVGGDWMPLWRLWVPVLPGLVWLGGVIAERSRLRALAGRLLLVMASGGVVLFGLGRASGSVWDERQRWIELARPWLADAERVATLDVGWVGAAYAGPLVDLAGATDPSIAYLSGGHTSKELPSDLLRRRDVDTLVLLTNDEQHERLLRHPNFGWTELTFARGVENRVTTLKGATGFSLVASVPTNTERRYLILRRAHGSTGSGATEAAQ